MQEHKYFAVKAVGKAGNTESSALKEKERKRKKQPNKWQYGTSGNAWN